MSVASCRIILGMGVFFILLGVAFILWSRKERKTYYNSLISRKDMKEFITHEPERLWLNAWQIGGWISLIIGIVLAVFYGWFCS
jgi:ABC-type Fe3+ transport system permease subunit